MTATKLSDLKLKSLTVQDRRLLEAIYVDFQVDSRASPTSLNLAGPVLTLLRSIVAERTGEDPDSWASAKVRAAECPLLNIPTPPSSSSSSTKTTTTTTKPPFIPTKGVFYFATSRNKYKVMGRTKVMECIKDSVTHQTSSTSSSSKSQTSAPARLNSHSLPRSVQAARIELFHNTHPAAPNWEGLFREHDFNHRTTNANSRILPIPKRSPFTLHHRPSGATVVKVNVEVERDLTDVDGATHKRTRVRLKACDGCPHNAKRR